MMAATGTDFDLNNREDPSIEPVDDDAPSDGILENEYDYGDGRHLGIKHNSIKDSHNSLKQIQIDSIHR